MLPSQQYKTCVLATFDKRRSSLPYSTEPIKSRFRKPAREIPLLFLREDRHRTKALKPNQKRLKSEAILKRHGAASNKTTWLQEKENALLPPYFVRCYGHAKKEEAKLLLGSNSQLLHQVIYDAFLSTEYTLIY